MTSQRPRIALLVALGIFGVAAGITSGRVDATERHAITIRYEGVNGQPFPDSMKPAAEAAAQAWSNAVVFRRPLRILVTQQPQSRVTFAYADEVCPTTDDCYSQPLYNETLAERPNDQDLIHVVVGADPSTYYLELDGQPPTTKVDLQTLVMRQIGYGLGIHSSFHSGGIHDRACYGVFVECPRQPPPNLDHPGSTAMDRAIVDYTGTPLVGNRAYPNGSRELYDRIRLGVYFKGKTAGLVKLWPLEMGESLSYLDQDTYGATPDGLLTPSHPPGTANHVIGPTTLAMLRDLGYLLPGDPGEPTPTSTPSTTSTTLKPTTTTSSVPASTTTTTTLPGSTTTSTTVKPTTTTTTAPTSTTSTTVPAATSTSTSTTVKPTTTTTTAPSATTSTTLPGSTTTSTATPPPTSTTSTPAPTSTASTSTTVKPTTTTTTAVPAPRIRLAVGTSHGGSGHARTLTAAGKVESSVLTTGHQDVSVALADLNGDGSTETVVGPGPNDAPIVRVYSDTGNELATFVAYDTAFAGGVNVAVGDVIGDARPEIVTAAGAGGGPHVKVFTSAGVELGGFMAYDVAFNGGVNVAVGDVLGGGKHEIVTGAGAGGGPHVKVFTGVRGDTALSFMAYAPHFAGGVYVAATNGSVWTGAGAGGGPHVRRVDSNGTERASFYAYAPDFAGGVRVASTSTSADGTPQLVFTAPGPGGGPHVRGFDANGSATATNFMAFDQTYTGGAQIAAAAFQ